MGESGCHTDLGRGLRHGHLAMHSLRPITKELSVFFYTDLAEALAQGRAPAISAQRGRDVMAILEAARRSHATGQTVVLDSPTGG
ncbi:MAG: hypothetical protein ACUVX9_10635 [Anaerolineae bacterium]